MWPPRRAGPRGTLAEPPRRVLEWGARLKGDQAREETMQALYTASATATGGRAGQVRSSDGALDLSLAWPKEIGGAGGAGTNPEQLFAAGYAACFAQALVRAARDRGVALDGTPTVATEAGVWWLENGRVVSQFETSTPPSAEQPTPPGRARIVLDPSVSGPLSPTARCGLR